MRRIGARLLLSGLAMAAMGCGRDQGEMRSMESLHAEYGVPVRVEQVVPKKLGVQYVYHAVLTGIEETSAASLLTDRVEAIRGKVGDRVVKDEVVVVFPTDNPQAQYYQAKVAVEHAQTTLKRIENLYQEGGVSLQELDNTRTQFRVAQANFEAVRQAVMVRAPIDGVITRIEVREADNVRAGDRLFTVSRTDRLKARVWATEDQVLHIAQRSAATAVWRDRTLHGRVTQVDLSLNDQHQAFGVVVEFDNPGQLVASGVNADIAIAVGDDAPAVVIARQNLRKEGDSWYVYVAEDGRAVRREVEVGRSYDVEVEISQGLRAGDLLITEGLELLADGARIRLVGQ